jgi:NAD(P)-dependent dehydrogenase (short-subunit alcohol dehydrogenase family)
MTDPNAAALLPADLFRDRPVFVTGGGSGINLGIARGFARLGAPVGICGRTEAKLEAAREELEGLGAKVYTGSCDVRDPAAVDRVVREAGDALGGLHTLVCGAAGNFPAPAETLSPNGFKAVVDIDLIGAFNACKAAFEALRASRGNVIFVSAGQAMYAYPMQAHVCAAKAGVDHLMRTLALEWGAYGIRANSIAPGPIADTEGMKRLAPPGAEARVAATVPLGRLGTVEDIASCAVFLASPLAGYVSGTVIMADGGQNLAGSGPITQVVREMATE